MIDGLLLTEAGLIFTPTLYGEEACHESVTLKPGRTSFELAVALHCFESKKPILGILWDAAY